LDIVDFWGRAILAFIFVLGVMIFVHEFGHYLVAKLLKIRVDVFSLGFGPRLFGFKRGETDYRISALPLGGYVKMAGETYEDELSGSPDEFLSRPKRQRFLVAVAGPLMNIALALVLTWFHFWTGFEVDPVMRQPATIAVIKPNSPAQKAGLEVGDTIVALAGKATPNWGQLRLEYTQRPSETVDLTIRRGDELLQKKVALGATRDEAGTLGAEPARPFVVAAVQSGTPAARAGVQVNDKIVRVRTAGGQTTSDADEIAALIAASKGQPVQFWIERGQQVLEKTIRPVLIDDVMRIGIGRSVYMERFGFFESMKESVKQNYELTLLTFNVLGRIITARASLRQMSGPIEIAKYSGAAAKAGAFVLLRLMALISLQLGIFNLLPIPILDGGVIALLGVEGLMRRDLSVTVKERIFQIGFIFLIILMGIIIINDITKQIPGV
jgi:regulator of sigma E protease